jgi:hypothetical protein
VLVSSFEPHCMKIKTIWICICNFLKFSNYNLLLIISLHVKTLIHNLLKLNTFQKNTIDFHPLRKNRTKFQALQKQIGKQEYFKKLSFNQIKIRNKVEKNTHIKINALKFNTPITSQIHNITNKDCIVNTINICIL